MMLRHFADVGTTCLHSILMTCSLSFGHTQQQRCENHVRRKGTSRLTKRVLVRTSLRCCHSRNVRSRDREDAARKGHPSAQRGRDPVFRDLTALGRTGARRYPLVDARGPLAAIGRPALRSQRCSELR